MAKEIILSLDPAASTGYCLTKLEKNKAVIYEYGFIDVDTTSEYQGDHCIFLMKELENIIEKHSVTHITVEDYFFSSRFAKGSNVNAAYRTAIHILSRQRSIPYTILNVSAWKTFVAGRSQPTKEQKKKWGATLAKKLFIQEALWTNYKFRFPNHSISQNTGKPILFRNDIIDVVAQCVYYCGLMRKIHDIALDVPVPEDVKFKISSKKIFLYPEE